MSTTLANIDEAVGALRQPARADSTSAPATNLAPVGFAPAVPAGRTCGSPLYALWDGTYVKEPYLALIDGKEIPCWPNAGEMCACDGSDRTWKPGDNIQVRICDMNEHVAADKALRKKP